MPADRPVTRAAVAGALTCAGARAVAPWYGVTVYEVIALPPSLAGAVQRTIAAPASSCAATPVGAVGGSDDVGVTALETADSGPAPVGLDAWTVKVYDVPAVSAEMVVLVVDEETVLGVCAVVPM